MTRGIDKTLEEGLHELSDDFAKDNHEGVRCSNAWARVKKGYGIVLMVKSIRRNSRRHRHCSSNIDDGCVHVGDAYNIFVQPKYLQRLS